MRVLKAAALNVNSVQTKLQYVKTWT